MKRPSGRDSLLAAMRLLGLGWFVVTILVLGTVAGVGLDRWTGLAPIFTLLGLGLGLAGAFLGLYRMIAPLLAGARKRKG